MAGVGHSLQIGGCETTDKRTGSKCKRFDGNRKLPRLPETGQRIKSIDSWAFQLSFSDEMHNYSLSLNGKTC